MVRNARASKSPVPPAVRRSSRQSTPVRDLASPPPQPASAARATRASAAGLPSSTSAPSFASLAPPVPDVSAAAGGSPGRGPRKSTSTRALSPRVAAKMSRPALPTHAANKQMTDDGKGGAAKPAKLHKVKTQTLHLGEDNGTIMIARVKCPVPKDVPGHIIKRFDTNAVSASSLFRAAFPTATEDEEAVEMRWIVVGSRGQYGDTAAAGMEHVESKKLSGTWIPAKHAHALATEYGIIRYARDLIDFAEPSSSSGPDTPQAPAAGSARDEFDDSPAVRSPKSKRARVASPLASKTSNAQALSGASGPGVSIFQTLATSEETGEVTETTEVKVDVPVAAPSAEEAEAAPAFDEAGAQQLREARELVESLKQSGTLSELSEATRIPESAKTNKRALEKDEDDDEDAPLPTEGTLADALGTVDNRSFWGKLFRRNRRKPTQASRETRALPAPRAVAQQQEVAPIPQVIVRDEDQETEGRRWAAGLGLAVAVGATAAAPYLFG
ncbi:hypothetical protein JCM8115_004983 [Rhodotorula mucilaginosa]|uniref:HTH APSES-type domain-containing protein n=1 Tax=Rhodotorula mucilaginosa TaxID=5537 RepID=A0A9P6WBA1_RHOMI|nr:hypothetical protein C6P46_000044 [Rhodotorula mucilaginosa]TKA57355.1 hypothetical protein B0A53_00584 [Rhodotorula sp. CCFEE 5036]